MLCKRLLKYFIFLIDCLLDNRSRVKDNPSYNSVYSDSTLDQPLDHSGARLLTFKRGSVHTPVEFAEFPDLAGFSSGAMLDANDSDNDQHDGYLQFGPSDDDSENGNSASG